MSIRANLVLSFGLTLAVTLVMAAGFYWATSQSLADQKRLGWSSEQLFQLQSFASNVSRQLKEAVDFVVLADEGQLKELRQSRRLAEFNLRRLVELNGAELASSSVRRRDAARIQADEEAEARTYGQIQAYHKEISTRIERLVSLCHSGEEEEAIELIADIGEEEFEARLAPMIHEAIEGERQQMERTTAHMQRAVSRFRVVAVGGCVAVLVVATLSVVVLTRSLRRIGQTQAERQALQEQLLVTAHRAGMADAATGVLHNVGNVLNAVNVSASRVTNAVSRSKTERLKNVVALIDEHADRLGAFFSEDEKGKRLPEYLSKLATHLAAERDVVREEVQSLVSHVDHIREIIRVQQSFAGSQGVLATCSLSDVVEDALTMAGAPFAGKGIQVIREYEELPPTMLERTKLLQALLNVILNAKWALLASDRQDKLLTVTLTRSGEDRVCIEVTDNGVGIPKENLTKVFHHGFTTKSDGHGFGLHNACNALAELGGSLAASSDGPGTGATLSVELPFQTAEALAVA